MNENSEADNKIVDGAPAPPEAPGYRRPRVKRPLPAATRFKWYFTCSSMALGLLAFHLHYDHSPDAFHDVFEYPVGAFFSGIAGLVAGVVVAFLLVGTFRRNKRKARIEFGVWAVLVIALLAWCARPVDPIQREIRWLDYPYSLRSISFSVYVKYSPECLRHYANLVRLGDAAVPALTKVLKTSQNPNAREEAVKILGEIYDESTRRNLLSPSPEQRTAVSSLLKATCDRNAEIAKAALGALARMGIDRQEINHRLADSLPNLAIKDQLRVSEFLVESGSDDIPIQQIINILNDQETGLSPARIEYRGRAMKLLGRIGPDARDCTPVLVRMLSSEVPGDVSRAARALATISPDVFAKEALPRVLNLLKAPDPMVRLNAVNCLAEGGVWTPVVVAALKAKQNDSFIDVREAAREALDKIESEELESPAPLVAPPVPEQAGS